MGSWPLSLQLNLETIKPEEPISQKSRNGRNSLNLEAMKPGTKRD
jgi:hypothetical protein